MKDETLPPLPVRATRTTFAVWRWDGFGEWLTVGEFALQTEAKNWMARSHEEFRIVRVSREVVEEKE